MSGSAIFRKIVWTHYKKSGRHDLPWRKTKDPYRILVSEVMLQQTQVERVIPFYKNFLKKFPTARALAKASLPEVLQSWQGLGYNRRAKMLHQAAKELIKNYGGEFPKSVEEIQAFPGVGPYTARAVATFAYNQDVIMIETNIRTAVISHSSRIKEKYRIRRLKNSRRSAVKRKSREWYGNLWTTGAPQAFGCLA